METFARCRSPHSRNLPFQIRTESQKNLYKSEESFKKFELISSIHFQGTWIECTCIVSTSKSKSISEEWNLLRSLGIYR